MAISFSGVIKGLLVQEESDRTKQISLEIDSGATTGTKTTIKSSQTANRTITMPDATDVLIGKATTDTLSNKTLDNSNSATFQDTNLTLQDDGDNTKQANFDLSGVTTSTTRTYTTPDADTTFVGTDATQTLQNKTIDNTNSATLQDTNLTIQDNADNTKQANFDLANVTTATTRTYSVPDADTTFVGDDATQTLQNKTIDNTNSATLQDTNFTLQDDGDNTKQANFDLSGVTTATTRTYTAPDADTTLVGTDATQTLTNKTLDANNNSVSNLAHGAEVDDPTSGVHGVTGNVVGTTDTQTLQNKTVDNTNTATLQDTNFTLQDDGDNTKQANFDLSGLTTATTRTYTGPDADTTLVGTDATQTLTNKTLTSPDIDTPTIDVQTLEEQGSTPSTPGAGNQKLYTKTDGLLYKLDSAGTEAPVGTSGQGQKNYLVSDSGLTVNSDFETGTGDWTTYDDGGAFVDGTGGAPSVVTLSQTTTTSEVLEKDASLKVSKAIGDGSGEGVSVVTRVLDRQDVGRELFGSLEIDATDANYTSEDLELIAYGIDTSNSSNNAIIPVLNDDDGKIRNLKGKVLFSVLPSENHDQIRLALHLASDSATGSAWDVFVDDVKLGPNIFVLGFNGSEPETFTPTGSWSTNISYTGVKWRVGNRLYMTVEGSLIGIPDTALLNIDIPDGLSIDTNNVKDNEVLGKGSLVVSSEGYPASVIQLNSLTDQVRVRYSDVDAGSASATEPIKDVNVDESSPVAWGNGDSFAITFSVPIDGWRASNIISTTEASQQTLKVQATTSSESIPNNSATTVVYDTENKDTHVAYDNSTGVFTAPFDGSFDIKAAFQFSGMSGGTGNSFIQISINSGSTIYRGTRRAINFPNEWHTANASVELNKDDTVEVEVFQNNGGSRSGGGHFSITGEPDLRTFGVASERNKVQTKTLSANVTSNGTISDLTFNNLVVGKYYTVQLQASLGVNEAGSSDNQVAIQINHDGNQIGRSLLVGTANTQPERGIWSNVITFQATDSTLTFAAESATANSNIKGTGTRTGTFAQLEERNDLIETTDFT